MTPGDAIEREWRRMRRARRAREAATGAVWLFLLLAACLATAWAVVRAMEHLQ